MITFWHWVPFHAYSNLTRSSRKNWTRIWHPLYCIHAFFILFNNQYLLIKIDETEELRTESDPNHSQAFSGFRMHPQLSKFPSNFFYEGSLQEQFQQLKGWIHKLFGSERLGWPPRPEEGPGGGLRHCCKKEGEEDNDLLWTEQHRRPNQILWESPTSS